MVFDLQHLLIKYRWVFVLLFLVPASLLLHLYSTVRNWIFFHLVSTASLHDRRVSDIQRQVRLWNSKGRGKQLMCTARPGWQAMSIRVGRYKHTHWNVRVELNHVLEVDTKNRTVRVEPMVNMGQLTSVLNPMGWTVPVVPELDDLTVGGLIMGCGIETSSHIYGLFHRTCTAYELVLADGSVIRATEHDNSELYHAVPWSHGTLGFLVATEVNVIPAQSYVHISYKPAQSRQELLRSFEKEARNVETNQFVEALVFSETNGVVMTGRMENTPTAKVNEIGRFWKPWFYKHVEQFLTVGPGEECMPLRDYYHRHSKSIFWELQHIVPFANNPLFRYLFGWTMPPKISLLKASQTQGIRQLYEQHHTMQDYLVPIKRVGESIDILHKEVQIYPLWLCPVVIPPSEGMVHPPKGHDELYVDVGAYGVPLSGNFHYRESTQQLEAFVRKSYGFQLLYADNFLSEQDFHEMFDHTLYNRMRTQLGCSDAFPDVYNKVSRAARTC